MRTLDNPKKDESPFRWEIADHLCAICFGRVLNRTTADGRKIYRCSNCETEAQGPGPQVLCCCGIKLRGKVDAGVRCRLNERRTPELPGRVVAEQLSPDTPVR